MKKLISLLLVLTMILTACSGGPAPGPGEEPKTPEGPKEDVTEGGKYAAEQVYKYTYAEEITTLNYMINTTWIDMSVAANLIDTLVQQLQMTLLHPLNIF